MGHNRKAEAALIDFPKKSEMGYLSQDCPKLFILIILFIPHDLLLQFF